MANINKNVKLIPFTLRKPVLPWKQQTILLFHANSIYHYGNHDGPRDSGI